QEHATGDEGDVLAGHGQQVVEAGGAEALAELGREPLILAEDDSLQHRSTLAVQTVRNRTSEPGSQTIRDAAEAAPPADGAPGARAQDDVHALPPQVRPLVEAVLRGARQAKLSTRGDDGALRRRAPRRQLELRALRDAEGSEPPHPDADALLE